MAGRVAFYLREGVNTRYFNEAAFSLDNLIHVGSLEFIIPGWSGFQVNNALGLSQVWINYRDGQLAGINDRNQIASEYFSSNAITLPDKEELLIRFTSRSLLTSKPLSRSSHLTRQLVINQFTPPPQIPSPKALLTLFQRTVFVSKSCLAYQLSPCCILFRTADFPGSPALTTIF